ncbi:DNA polymerase/3'-5' exonuclease PolX [Candidatus Parcubacteria bacterium]|nr:DNA polymerase/3'-5' exonuclease PolX [Candidatus Parcubacteria bacterium]
MKNQEIAEIFYQIARFLQIDGVQFKPYAYQKAAASLEGLKDDVGDIYRKGGRKALEEIPGIGKAMSEHIEEYLKTKKVKFLEEFKKGLPVKMDELLRVEGLGPKKIKVLYEKLGIKNLKDLEKAVKKHQIAPLFGFGETTEKNIVQGLEFAKQNKGRVLLHAILPTAREVLKKLEALPEVKKASLAGSLRRRKETIGDVDFLVVSKNPKKVMDFFVKLPGVKKIWGQGGTKASVHMAEGFDMDLRVVPAESYGSALQYFTGSQAHNIVTRKIAIDKGLKLSEYGVFKGSTRIAGKTEEEVYKAIGLDYIEPELREDNGEVDAYLAGNLPKLVELKDIKGDLHCHSDWNGGEHSIEVMAKTAMEKGYEYIGISDHSKTLQIENGLNEEKFLKQSLAIKKINEKFRKDGVSFRILHGCEADILKDGSIDIKDEVLAQLDYVIASVHLNTKMEKKEMMERLGKAMKNPNVDIIAHPTGRIVNQREEYAVDMDLLLKLAKETGTILEINSSERMDLRDFYIRRAKEEGVKMVINTDSHAKEHMDLMEYGVSQARRGWAEAKDIINTLPAEEFLKALK